VAGTSTTATFVLNSITVTRTAREFVVLEVSPSNLQWTFNGVISLPLPP